MDVFYSYNYGTAAWLALQAAPLIVSPHMITTMLSSEVRKATVLEEYFCRSLGFSLIALAILTILLTGSVPLTSTFAESSEAGVTTDPADPKAPYAVPTLTLTVTFHAACAFYGYTQYMTSGQTGFAIGVAVYSSLAAMGLWCILFASSSGRISRKTGADKRTSGFPFKNAEADKKKAR
ncbi:MAG: hypothetical protein M1830_008118 [Pleopsidium flavum]|nr:MAG: hypothetical protein M1830_008118 [Pleopsidium flavum]